MLNVTPAFKRKLYNNERDYINRLEITLADGTQLSVNNEHIMGSSGVELDDAVGEDDNFSALGSTIINSATFVLYNNDEIYSDYDFINAKVVYYTGLNIEAVVNDQPTTVLEEIKKGTFTVDEATYSQATITLYVLDYMEQFDRPYSSSTLTYPATLAEIVRDACYNCLGSASELATQQFPHYNYSIPNRPEDEAITYREVLGYVATLAGCFARCNVSGKLELKWFDTNSLFDTSNNLDGGTLNPWTAGNVVSGGTLNPWTGGTIKDGGEFTSTRIPHYITALWTADIAVDDVVITGISATIEVADPDNPNSLIDRTYLNGTDDYIISIENNPFITEFNVNEILGWLQTQLVGLTFRKCDVSHQNDPSIEAGDVGYIWDTKGVEHPILITRATFTPNAPQTIVCGASTPSRNSASRFSQLTKSFVKSKKLLKLAENPYARALADLAEVVNSATGLYETQETEGGATIIYRHNKPTLEQSDIVQKISSVGITFTTNYRDETPIWYGSTVDGTVVANVLYAHGINADWINTGTLQIIKDNKEIFYANVDTGIVRIAGDFGTLNSNGLTLTKGSIDIGNGNFVVDSNGNLTGKNAVLTGADVSGTVKASAGKIGEFTINGSGFNYNSGGIAGTYDYTRKDRLSIDRRGLSITKETDEHTVVLHDGTIIFGTLNIPGIVLRNKLDSTGLDGGQWWYAFEIANAGSDTSYFEVNTHGWRVYSPLYNTYYLSLNKATKIEDSLYVKYNVLANSLDIVNDADFYGNMTVQGTKSRVVDTEDYASRLFYCYETPSPYFGDIGEGVIGEDGLCYVPIDAIFAEAVTLTTYQVFLQTYSENFVSVVERKPGYFVVKGVPGDAFGWELKAKQSDFDQRRLDIYAGQNTSNLESEINYADEAIKHINQIKKEREIA